MYRGNIDRSLKREIDVDTYCSIMDRMAEIAREAMNEDKPMSYWMRLGYALMAVELLGIDVIDDEFYENFIKCVFPEYWAYQRYGEEYAPRLFIEIRFQHSDKLRSCSSLRSL